MIDEEHDVPDRIRPPVRAPAQHVGRLGYAVVLGATMSIAVVAAVMWTRAQVQVSIRVLDACTVGTPRAPDAAACSARPEVRRPIAGDHRSRDHQPPPREETQDDGFTTFVF